MNRFYAYRIVLLSLSIYIYNAAIESNQIELASDDDIAHLFSDEDESCDIAEIAAQTTFMQEKIEVKSVSPFVLAARKVWDRMLIFYLWMQQKYAKVRVYMRERFNRQNNGTFAVQDKAE